MESAMATVDHSTKRKPKHRINTTVRSKTRNLSFYEFESRVAINISGLRYETRYSTLAQFPDTLLGNPGKRQEYFDCMRNEYFFDRSRICFDSILFFYQSGGRLRKPHDIPIDIFIEELRFFELGEDVIWKFGVEMGYTMPEDHILPENETFKLIWTLFEFPDSSVAAKCVTILSIVVISISVITFCIETLPEFEEYEGHKYFSNPFFVIEALCVVWFVIEYLCRLLSSPNKRAFLKNFMNCIDLASIIPFFFTLLVMNSFSGFFGPEGLAILRVVRLGRVLRVLKLSRHSKSLQVLFRTFQESKNEFGLLIIFIATCVFIFSSAIFFAEGDDPQSKFQSIPDGFWWSIITMTTVGYGDVTPSTTMGRIIGSLCAITGVLTISLPVPVIVSNFNHHYSNINSDILFEKCLEFNDVCHKAMRGRNQHSSNGEK